MEMLIPNVLTPAETADVLEFAWVSVHHDDHGHGGGHLVNIKPNYLPSVADRAFRRILLADPSRGTVLRGLDPWMKFYRLGDNARGRVLPHMDEDFVCPTGQTCRWSLLIYLGGDYEGGETVFETSRVIAHPDPGTGLIFPHSLVHEGRPVRRGTKFILKTDLY